MVLGKITYFCQTCSAYFSAPARWIRDYWSAWWVFSSVPRSLQSRTKMTLRSSIWRAPRMTFRLRNSRNPPWRFCSWEQILNGGIFQHAMFDPCLITREYGIHTIDGWYFNCGNSCWFRNSLHIWPCGHSIHPCFFFSLYLRFKPDVRFESGVHGFSPDGFPQQSPHSLWDPDAMDSTSHCAGPLWSNFDHPGAYSLAHLSWRIS